MSGKVFEKEYEIHYYEIDYKRRVLITSIIQYLEDIAILQSETLGVGIDFLKKNNMAWVLYNWDITLDKYPGLGEKILVRTWPHSFNKFYAYRQFEIVGSEGEVIGRANSVWFLINTERRRPIRVNESIYDAYGVKYEEGEIIDIEKIAAPKQVSEEKTFHVRYSDIDTNKHVNNTKYIAWALETIPMNIITEYTLNNLKVIYEKETTYGEMINVHTEISEVDRKVTGLHKITDKEGKGLTLLKTTWIK